jgi:hypothetical protein
MNGGLVGRQGVSDGGCLSLYSRVQGLYTGATGTVGDLRMLLLVLLSSSVLISGTPETAMILQKQGS